MRYGAACKSFKVYPRRRRRRLRLRRRRWRSESQVSSCSHLATFPHSFNYLHKTRSLLQPLSLFQPCVRMPSHRRGAPRLSFSVGRSLEHLRAKSRPASFVVEITTILISPLRLPGRPAVSFLSSALVCSPSAHTHWQLIVARWGSQSWQPSSRFVFFFFLSLIFFAMLFITLAPRNLRIAPGPALAQRSMRQPAGRLAARPSAAETIGRLSSHTLATSRQIRAAR